MKNLQKWAIWLKSFLIIFLVLSAVFIAYRNALNNGFLTTWDTQGYVINNAHIKALSWENIQWMLTSFHMENWHPLTWLSHALDYALFELEPWGHHLVSIIIHGLNTVLVFVLVIVLMSFKPSGENGFVSVTNKTLLAAGITAILFGIHPQHVESVVWVAERKDVLCLFFVLLALLSYVFYNAAHTTNARFGWYLSTLLFFVLALFAKPMAVTFPVILLLMDVYPLHRTSLTTASCQRNSVSYKKLVIEKIPFLAFTLFSVIMTILAQHHGGAIFTIEEAGIQIRLLNAFDSLIFYISKFFAPITLSPFYPFPSSQGIQEYSSLIPVFAFFLITFVCGYLWYQKKYYWLITWLFYLVTLSPVIGIIKVGNQAAADRYVYLPTIPFYILIGIGIASLLCTEKIRKILKVGIVTVFLVVSITLLQLTQKQTLIWKNDLTFWGYIVAYAPDSALAQFHLGNVYLKIGESEKAVEHYHQAVSLEPRNKWWYKNLPMAYIRSNRLPEAVNLLNRLVERQIYIGYSWDNIHYMIGRIYFIQGRLQEAQHSLTKALQLNPENKRAQDLLLDISSR
jgi:protein O-mannosyl-transferase